MASTWAANKIMLKSALSRLKQWTVAHKARSALYPIIATWKRKFNAHTEGSLTSTSMGSNSYIVKQSVSAVVNRPHVVHVIANFCTGGSSRLVVDLIEHLGHDYKHCVLTSYIPIPAAYVGVDITECRFPANLKPFLKYFSRIKPALIHVHYWGDCDEYWYSKAFDAAAQLGIPVVENINTPISPYISSAVKRYVHVSDYVRREFGGSDPSHVTIYPGSDFSHFYRDDGPPLSGDCVGMVYRLERDKLNEASILPFIHVAKKRPNTRVLIVGGGSLLENFKQEVIDADVARNFEFTGYVSYEKLPEYYRQMAVFVAPVWKESFGQVSPFAMNMKIPVCGYDVGAIGEIVGNPDLLAPAAHAECLADIVIRLLDLPKERDEIGEYQHQRAQAKFSVQAMIRAYDEIYKKITNSTRE
jgi:glycosyltransferase involved in cell wall biosynthesis